MELSPLYSRIEDLQGRIDGLRGYLDYAGKEERLEEVQRELEENPDIWNQPEQAQALNKERAQLEGIVLNIREITDALKDSRELLEMAEADDDAETVSSVEADVAGLTARVEALEFRRMFSGEMDEANAYVDIQAGSGGTEAQDWANMLLRMYLRWAESKGFKVEVTELSEGETAGIKSATVRVEGDHAFGWLRTETGVHRLVRKSPFDSGNRRHTSFASVFVSPEVDENIEIEIDPSDLRVDTYRSSGAGGQHVNTTDSAVRITHEPTGIVAACQAGRSQHKNREMAMNQLRAKLYEQKIQEQNAAKQAQEETKSDIGWGSQIRSYVLDQSRIKDLRTGVEVGNTQGVLDGNLDSFIEASLKSGL
ncbi:MULTISPECIES: peptide chain release factor 2 [unclassified Thioalkalivibrio]|uniref:peptide chain release factor 2 n=1 Tax=unclassified Thioalkalivibrio TaxID=2621013 RepID=UPI0012DE1949|nr:MULTISPECIES: peptide chain release factor 2 [unclassified Thioalkalivibrio]